MEVEKEEYPKLTSVRLWCQIGERVATNRLAVLFTGNAVDTSASFSEKWISSSLCLFAVVRYTWRRMSLEISAQTTVACFLSSRLWSLAAYSKPTK